MGRDGYVAWVRSRPFVAPFALVALAGLVAFAAEACGSSGDSGGAAPLDASVRGDTGEAPDAPAAFDASLDGGALDARDARDSAPPPRGPLALFASGNGADLATFQADPKSGALTLKGKLAAGDPSPSFLAIRPGGTHLYAVGESTAGRVGAYAIHPSTGALTYLGSVSSQGDGPAFVSVDATGKWVLVANYGDGTVAVFPIQADGKLGAPSDTRAVGANAHMIATDPSNAYVFVPCLGADYVAQFLFDDKTGKLTPNATPTVATASGAGPRHIAFHPDGAHAYVISELTSSLTTYGLNAATGTLTPLATVSTLPVGFSGSNTGAEVSVHPTGAFVYASNRGDDSIAVFAVDPAAGTLTLKGHTKTGGTTPRSFALDLAGTLLYAANQGSGTVTPFAVNPATGTLSPIGAAVTVPSATFVGLAWLPGP